MESNRVETTDSEYFFHVLTKRRERKVFKSQHLKTVMRLFIVEWNAIKRWIWHLLTSEQNLVFKEVKIRMKTIAE